MRVVIAGATGFIGRALCRELHGDYEPVALSRDARKAADVLGPYARVVEWDGRTTSGWKRQVDGAAAVVNLAGENIATGRWSRAKKDCILRSRLNSVRAVLDALEGVRNKPRAFVQGSAVGYYGPRGDEQLDEGAAGGTGFLAEVCRKTEAAASAAEHLGTRTVVVRTGLVLGPHGGIVPRLARSFRLFLGGHIGTGKQWVSWISLRDQVQAIRFLVEQGGCRGPYNLTAPEPVPMKAFYRALGEALRRPAWTVLPGFVAKLAFGEMADEVLLAGQNATPKRLTEAGFEFEYPEVGRAFSAIFGGSAHESA
jgi:uncharacterized protein (TIGR01777 family)